MFYAHFKNTVVEYPIRGKQSEVRLNNNQRNKENERTSISCLTNSKNEIVAYFKVRRFSCFMFYKTQLMTVLSFFILVEKSY